MRAKEGGREGGKERERDNNVKYLVLKSTFSVGEKFINDTHVSFIIKVCGI